MQINKKRFFLACFIGALVTAITGSMISTHRIIAASLPLNEVYAEKMTLGIRLSTMFDDLIQFGPLFLFFIFIAFLIAMGAATALANKRPSLKLPICLGAGFMAMIVMLNAMKLAFFNVDIVAGGRDIAGYLWIGLAGMLGAYVFYRLYRQSFILAASPDLKISSK